MSAGNYGFVCQNCGRHDDVSHAYRAMKCDTCPHHLSRLREQAAIDIYAKALLSTNLSGLRDDDVARIAVRAASKIIAALKGGEE